MHLDYNEHSLQPKIQKLNSKQAGRQILQWTQPTNNTLGVPQSFAHNLDPPVLPDRDWMGCENMYSGPFEATVLSESVNNHVDISFTYLRKLFIFFKHLKRNDISIISVVACIFLNRTFKSSESLIPTSMCNNTCSLQYHTN